MKETYDDEHPLDYNPFDVLDTKRELTFIKQAIESNSNVDALQIIDWMIKGCDFHLECEKKRRTNKL